MKIIFRIILVLLMLICLEVNALYINSNEIKNIFQTEKYNITLNGNGGTFSKQDKLIVFKEHIKLPIPTKEGYIFSHYSTNIGNYSYEIEDINLINNKELLAKWKYQNYQIMYDLDGGTLDEIISEYTIDDEFTLPIPKKENSIFLGWTSTDNKIPIKEVKITKGTTGDLYFKANWQEEKYKIKVVSKIDNILYKDGLEYFTYNVWINDELLHTSIYTFEEELIKGTKVRIETIKKEGIETNYDETIIIDNNYEFNPEWTINEYDSEFYLDDILVGITKNKFNSQVSVPYVDIEQYGYSNSFFYLSAFISRESWYQKPYTLYFDAKLEQYNCMASFGSATLTNAYQQLTRIQENGIYNCGVNEGWRAVECNGKATEILDIYNRIWNILPYSGTGYSRYKQISCGSGYNTSSNR